MKEQDVINYIMSIQTREELNRMFDVCKRRHSQLVENLTFKFKIGDIVKFTGRYGVMVTGKITKINRKTLSVTQDITNTRWTVSPQLVVKQ